MPTIKLDFEIYCVCGEDLCNQKTTVDDRGGTIRIVIGPCSKCVDRAKDESDGEGYKRGYKDGESEGEKP